MSHEFSSASHPVSEQYVSPQYHADNLAPNNAYALVSLPLAFIVPLLGLIFGIIGRKQIAQTNERGAGFALAGIIIGAIQIVAFVLYIALLSSVFLPLINQLSNSASTSL
jgi:hypothetical protein